VKHDTLPELGPPPPALAGFTDERVFLERAVSRRFVRLEVLRRAAAGYAASGALMALGGAVLAGRGARDAALMSAVCSAVLAALAVRAGKAELERRRGTGTDWLASCVQGERGELVAMLGPGEELLLAHDLSGPTGGMLRRAAAWAQAFMGFLMAGLPPAVLASRQDPGPWLIAWAWLVALGGAAVFGRGIHLVVGATPAQRLVLTNQRLVALGAPGAARSLLLSELRHKPAVVERLDGTATVAFAFERLKSAGLFPLMGIWGLDGVAAEAAREWAQAVRARQVQRLGQGPPATPEGQGTGRARRAARGKKKRP
jgi:hypothetical protein